MNLICNSDSKSAIILLVSSMFTNLWPHITPWWSRLDMHLLQVFVGGVFIAMVLHLAQVTLLRTQHRINLFPKTKKILYYMITNYKSILWSILSHLPTVIRSLCVCFRLTSTMPWLMVPYCLFLSRTRLITITVAIAMAITSKPIRVPFPKLNSPPRGRNISWFPLWLNC